MEWGGNSLSTHMTHLGWQNKTWQQSQPHRSQHEDRRASSLVAEAEGRWGWSAELGGGVGPLKRYGGKGLLEKVRLAFRSILFEVDEGREKEQREERWQNLFSTFWCFRRAAGDQRQLGWERKGGDAAQERWSGKSVGTEINGAGNAVCADVCVYGGGNSHLVAR